MNNYANWELTQLLPIKDEESDYIWFKYNDWWANKENLHDTYLCKIEETCLHGFDEKCIFLRDGYSWEDIRLYLKSKKISFVVWEYDINNKIKYGFIAWSKNNLLFPQYSSCNNDDITFDTYEQAREEAIKYCLNKLNKN